MEPNHLWCITCKVEVTPEDILHKRCGQPLCILRTREDQNQIELLNAKIAQLEKRQKRID